MAGRGALCLVVVALGSRVARTDAVGEVRAGKIRNGLVRHRKLRVVDGIAFRFRQKCSYNSVYVGGDQLLASTHVYGLSAPGVPGPTPEEARRRRVRLRVPGRRARLGGRGTYPPGI